MNLLALFGINKQKVKEQALYEAEIVNAVGKHLDDKISEFDTVAIDLNFKLEQREREFLTKTKAGAPERELRRISDSCYRMEMQISLNNDKTDDFLRVRDILFYLEMYVQAVIDYEWYEYLVKVIPERKLPSMINNENELSKVTEMVEVIIEKIKRKMIHSIKDKEELERTLRKIEERAAMMKENYSSNKSKDLNTRMRELEKKYGMENVEYTMPASATETANVNATNHNKA